ncbi:hypothetical protein [Pseudomonas frederiksbergensis]|uniref:Uncharacterized protein n=1 Tax=Pseudomonas frederiksbergensis TaxID=104087 RepID=A0A423KHM1_9PSED|nr:hypothetical protein [Pseudomonas frederiksbergensis]RON52588.1 hypothetical protein BK665_16180 [Pseudomonas frederiksbergensis]
MSEKTVGKSIEDSPKRPNVLFAIINSAASDASSAWNQKPKDESVSGSVQDVSLQSGETTVHVRTEGGSMQGWVKFPWTVVGDQIRFGNVQYKIDRGATPGGNQARIWGYVMAGSTGDFSKTGGIQDNQWHDLGGSMSIYLGSFMILIVAIRFDRSGQWDLEGEGAEHVIF